MKNPSGIVLAKSGTRTEALGRAMERRRYLIPSVLVVYMRAGRIRFHGERRKSIHVVMAISMLSKKQ